MKKIFISLGLLCLSVILGISVGIYKKNHVMNEADSTRVYAQSIVMYDGFDNVLEDSDIIVTGEVQEIIIHNLYDEYTVKVTDTHKGEAIDNITVRNYLYDYSYSYEGTDGSGRTNTNYKEGQSYIFVLQHISNVYEDQYVILSDVYIPINNIESSTVLSGKIEDISNPKSYIKDYKFKNKNGKGNQLSLDYIKSDKVKDIVENSKYIVDVEVKEHCRSTDVVDVYLCNVIEVFKGDVTTTEENQIIIPFFKNTVEIGKSYVVNLTSDTEDALIYSLSSKNSVMEENEKGKLKKMIGKE